jgi:hypothetical protein
MSAWLTAVAHRSAALSAAELPLAPSLAFSACAPAAAKYRKKIAALIRANDKPDFIGVSLGESDGWCSCYPKSSMLSA